jgi:nucleoside-diphosphate-sugar epimerase
VAFQNELELDARLSRPSEADIEAVRRWDGDLLVLGAAGKMGPSLVERARRAADQAGRRARVIAVSRFSDRRVKARLETAGVKCIESDLLAPGALEMLPEAPNVIHMAARKFGTTGEAHLTWASNVLLPALVARRFATARMVAFSTGNVYPLTASSGCGPDEMVEPAPVGEYAQSALGRERLLDWASRCQGTRLALLRLNYAIDMRYGVLADIAWKVKNGEPVDVGMGYVNVIWQGDANSVALRSIEMASSPAFVINLTGTEKSSVRELAMEFGQRLGVDPVIRGQEAETALLSDARRCRDLFGPGEVSLGEMIDWVADWVNRDGERWNKPTHFEVRTGRF